MSDLVCMLVYQIRIFEHNGCTLSAWRMSPFWEGGLCCGHGVVNVPFSPSLHFICDQAVVFRVENGQGFARGRRNVLQKN